MLQKETHFRQNLPCLTDRNTPNPKHSTKTSLRNSFTCWAVNSIIAVTNAKFPEINVLSVGQFIHESHCTDFMSLRKSYAMPVQQILTTKKPTKTLKSDTVKEGLWTTNLAFSLILRLGKLFGKRAWSFVSSVATIMTPSFSEGPQDFQRGITHILTLIFTTTLWWKHAIFYENPVMIFNWSPLLFQAYCDSRSYKSQVWRVRII